MNDVARYFDESSERPLLGGLLACGDFAEVSDLSAEDFSSEVHREVFRSCARLAPEVSIDCAGVWHDLSQRGKAEIVSMAVLMDLHAASISGISLTGFARSIREKTTLRRAVRLSEKIGGELALHASLNGNAAAVAEACRELAELADGTASNERTAIREPKDIPEVGATQERITHIRPELPEGSVIALTGDAESGKSTLATAWARDAILDERDVFFLDRENPRATVLERMTRLGLADCPRLHWWGGWCGEDAPDPSSPILARWVQSCDRRPVVIVDSLSAFHGGDENDATLMRQFMNGPRKLASLGAGVIVLHHIGKTPGLEYRGSSDFKAAIDQGFVVSNVGGDRLLDRLRLRPFKSRYGFCGEIIYRYADGRMVRDEEAYASIRTQAEQLAEILRQNPGIKTGPFEDRAIAAGISRKRVRDFLDNGVQAGTIDRTTGERNSKSHTLVGA